jgi:hypothetical protein
MKQYKHKKTGYVATGEPVFCGTKYIVNRPGMSSFYEVPSDIIEDSADWIPVNPVLLVTEDQVEIDNSDLKLYLLCNDFITFERTAGEVIKYTGTWKG